MLCEVKAWKSVVGPALRVKPISVSRLEKSSHGQVRGFAGCVAVKVAASSALPLAHDPKHHEKGLVLAPEVNWSRVSSLLLALDTVRRPPID